MVWSRRAHCCGLLRPRPDVGELHEELSLAPAHPHHPVFKEASAVTCSAPLEDPLRVYEVIYSRLLGISGKPEVESCPRLQDLMPLTCAVCAPHPVTQAYSKTLPCGRLAKSAHRRFQRAKLTIESGGLTFAWYLAVSNAITTLDGSRHRLRPRLCSASMHSILL